MVDLLYIYVHYLIIGCVCKRKKLKVMLHQVAFYLHKAALCSHFIIKLRYSNGGSSRICQLQGRLGCHE